MPLSGGVPLGMEPFVVEPAVSGTLIVAPEVMHMAAAAYLARFKGQSRVHAESGLRGCLMWCTDQQRTSGHRIAGTTLLLAWTVDTYLVVSAASGQPVWSWDELATIAAKQRERLTA